MDSRPGRRDRLWGNQQAVFTVMPRLRTSEAETSDRVLHTLLDILWVASRSAGELTGLLIELEPCANRMRGRCSLFDGQVAHRQTL